MGKKIVIAFGFLLLSTAMRAQNRISGKVEDLHDGHPLKNVHVVVEGENEGSISDSGGNFSVVTGLKKGKLRFIVLGYRKKEIPFNFNEKKKTLSAGIIYLEPVTYSLNEITVSSGLVNRKETAVAVTEINSETISNELSDRPLPLIFNSDPSLFAVRNGGGSGDALLTMRGFKQENTALLLNGIPINGEENGLVYWSNWLGLTEAVGSVQIQKGPGFANITSNAVGGSINMITVRAGARKGGTCSLQITSYGNKKAGFSYRSGKTPKNWQTALSLAVIQGKGYVEATPVKGFSYFFTASKIINDKNSVSVTLLGAPQYHEQRTLKLSYDEVKLHGYRYNKEWGGLDGKVKNASANFYHKPFLTIAHNLTLSKTKHLSTTLYFSYGTGGGKWSESFGDAPSIFSYRTPSGRIDWETIYNENANHDDQYILDTGDTVCGYSKHVETGFLASHVETGFLSAFEQKTGNHLTWTTGIYYRYFNSYLREEISDLWGGRFFIEDYRWSLAGVAGRNQIKTVGDIIKADNNSVINTVVLYTKFLYDKNRFHGFFTAKATGVSYKRIDRYNYINHISSDVIIRPGFDMRGGAGWQLNRNHKFYVNGAYISKVPYFKYVFGNFTNVPVRNLKNENIYTVETGYVLSNILWKLQLTGYYTLWHNVSMLTNEYVQLENNNQSRAMINGLNELHKGLEINLEWQVSPSMKLGLVGSTADFRWLNNVSARLVNNENVITDTVFVYVKGLHVGGTAQQKAGVTASVRLWQKVGIKAELYHYDKLFANFNPVNRNEAENSADAYRFPGYNLLNLYVTVPFKLFTQQAMFQLNGFNLLNEHYIETGEDGNEHNLKTFRGFWSFGTEINLLIKVFF